MKAFRLLTRGDNFSVELENIVRVMGFYVPIFVLAPDATTALGRAQEQLERRLAEKHVRYTADSATVVEAVEEIDPADLPPTPPGFAWFSS